ncbi:hypothetical protein PISL3812_04037 [Talaromyces islandicus]|uniref:NAD(P)-binding domain-containing protein n=1 Tax=Talaromyces islandicus TaxID=28573 RepID=A0A0U1LUD7_TALIS|nr:hypothetical protein PISL3812_04037 [Talaromyces islandicus]
MESETILILGATGGSGIAFVEEALKLPSPPNLVLYVRTASKLPARLSSHPKVSVVTGYLHDYNTLDSALKAHHVTTVVSFLGAYASISAMITRATDTPIANCFPGIISAMKQHGVRRLLALSTPSYWVEGKDVGTWKLSMYSILPKVMVPQGNAEMVKIAENVNELGEDLDWTIFRIPHLTDGPGDVSVWAGYAGPDHKGSLDLSRRSMGRWVIGEISERTWIKEAPFLGNY